MEDSKNAPQPSNSKSRKLSINCSVNGENPWFFEDIFMNELNGPSRDPDRQLHQHTSLGSSVAYQQIAIGSLSKLLGKVEMPVCSCIYIIRSLD